jgi:hypothetical protein
MKKSVLIFFTIAFFLVFLFSSCIINTFGYVQIINSSAFDIDDIYIDPPGDTYPSLGLCYSGTSRIFQVESGYWDISIFVNSTLVAIPASQWVGIGQTKVCTYDGSSFTASP